MWHQTKTNENVDLLTLCYFLSKLLFIETDLLTETIFMTILLTIHTWEQNIFRLDGIKELQWNHAIKCSWVNVFGPEEYLAYLFIVWIIYFYCSSSSVITIIQERQMSFYIIRTSIFIIKSIMYIHKDGLADVGCLTDCL